jgi:hypothetical protein
MPVAPLSDLGLASGSGLASASTSAAATSGLPSGPPPPPDTAMPVTPPTSPQRSQHAARQHERDSRIMGSPENRRTPAASNRPPTLNGREYHNLPAHIAAQLAALPSFPVPQRRSRRAASSVSFNF